jgi:hypothetical protein
MEKSRRGRLLASKTVGGLTDPHETAIELDSVRLPIDPVMSGKPLQALNGRI